MRIFVVPLDLRQLESLVMDASHLDAVPVAPGALPPRLVLERAAGALDSGKPAVWFAPFVFVDNRVNQIVGAGGFKGSPVEHRVEIGYGVAEQFRGKGIATTAVRELLEVAFSDPDVVEVYAETATDNAASRRVVEKVGFRHLGQRPTQADGIVDRWLRAK